MLRKSKFSHVVAISLSCSVFDLAPALAGDYGSQGYDAGYVVPQTSYPAVIARYCDGYGGGQWPYGCGSAGRPVPAPTVAVVAVPPAPRRGLPPIVTKY
jgi:hypothetical protein